MDEQIAAGILLLILIFLITFFTVGIVREHTETECIKGRLIFQDNQVYKCVKVEMKDGI